MTQTGFVKLSDLIALMETKIQVKYIRQFREAAKAGEIDCLPIEKSFAVRGSMYRDLMTQQGRSVYQLAPADPQTTGADHPARRSGDRLRG